MYVGLVHLYQRNKLLPLPLSCCFSEFGLGGPKLTTFDEETDEDN